MEKLNFADSELWLNMKSGDLESFSVIYNKYYIDLFHYGLKISGDENLTKDCIHDLFSQLWTRKEVTNQVFRVKPYLIKCFRRRIVRELKQAKDIKSCDSEQVFDSPVGSFENQLIEIELYEENINKLLFALQNLTRRQKEAVHMKYYLELEYEEICEIMDLQYQSVRNLISEGIKKMRETFKQTTTLDCQS